jgi:alpha-tubulin suppressor-like RCC1 family protein
MASEQAALLSSCPWHTMKSNEALPEWNRLRRGRSTARVSLGIALQLATACSTQRAADPTVHIVAPEERRLKTVGPSVRPEVELDAADESTDPTLRIALGVDYACLIRADGQLFCWGSNRFGQLGDGSVKRRHMPVRVPIPGGVRDVSLNLRYTCAVTLAGRVACWGSRFNMETEAVAAEDTVPHFIAGVDNARRVAVGDWHACALRADGQVICWGVNLNQQIARGQEVERAATLVDGLAGARRISVGSGATCSVFANGTVKCSGTEPLTADDARSDGAPALLPGLSGVRQLALRAQECALSMTGKVACWGHDTYGQVGTPLPATSLGSLEIPAPTEVPGVANAVQIALGDEQSCALLQSGRVVCWGLTRPDLPLGDSAALTPPILVEGIENATAIAAGGSSICAVIAHSEIRCWGQIIGDRHRGNASPIPTVIAIP